MKQHVITYSFRIVLSSSEDSVCLSVLFTIFFFRDHAHELGNPVPEKPVIFFKPSTSYLRQNGEIRVSV